MWFGKRNTAPKTGRAVNHKHLGMRDGQRIDYVEMQLQKPIVPAKTGRKRLTPKDFKR